MKQATESIVNFVVRNLIQPPGVPQDLNRNYKF